jgi:hypothetical protein
MRSWWEDLVRKPRSLWRRARGVRELIGALSTEAGDREPPAEYGEFRSCVPFGGQRFDGAAPICGNEYGQQPGGVCDLSGGPQVLGLLVVFQSRAADGLRSSWRRDFAGRVDDLDSAETTARAGSDAAIGRGRAQRGGLGAASLASRASARRLPVRFLDCVGAMPCSKLGRLFAQGVLRCVGIFLGYSMRRGVSRRPESVIVCVFSYRPASDLHIPLTCF